MTPTQIIELAVAMREAQAKAATSQTKMNRDKARALELRFDHAARRYLDEPKDNAGTQAKMFGTI